MLKKLVLIGGGGFSSEVAEVAAQNGFEVTGYVDVVKTDSDLRYLGVPEDFILSSPQPEFVFPAFGAVDR
jgi:NADPH-dependent 2,4-dienoyl-CoA reductase/sulfur reductase-like enzyme